MTGTIVHDVEDIGAAIAVGRPIRPQGPYRVMIGDGQLQYRPCVVESPVPTGAEILDAAAARPVSEHLIFVVLGSGLLEELRLDETIDLRHKGSGNFLIFLSDRSFRFLLDGRQFEWGMATITGRTLKALAGVPAEYGVWLERRGDDDLPVGDNEEVDLSQPGVERFFTGKTTTTEG